ncbi:arsenate reductase (glutaredoxin) [Galbibacter sp.]|uniref:arsenate reductase (glutaredoxin) n=1 Tax=Galbibacter sp. TaxID=2918471 RepID=UPI002C6E47D2|nr:arsenate reductase (glutaredoxin) [Galbibacter sp.]HLV63176.1 arsenate reductase (glutaredoxin) [Galbibacter sp.]
MIKIYHNPRCQKSREGLQLLESTGKEIKIIKYLEDTPTISELTQIIKTLGISPIELVRTKEEIWKKKYKDLALSDQEIIAAMVENPRLIERPIVIHDNKAVIGRPLKNIEAIL